MTRLLCLGDSYTIGEGVPAADRWPVRVADALGADGITVAPPEIVAVTGWTMADLAGGIASAALAPPYDAVTLLIGVNDQYDGTSAERLRAPYRALLGTATRLAGGDARRVVAVSVPDWGPTTFGAADPRGPAGIAPEIDALNTMEQAEACAAGVAWADVTALSRSQGERTVADGLHPDAEAYRTWTERIAPAVRAALGAA